MKILALDTATERCSAALWLDGTLSLREAQRERAAGELILPMIEQLLAEAGLRLRGLDALAFGRGPGGFTGVRLAASIVQGLAFASDLPVIPVSDLRALAAQAFALLGAGTRVIACQDARMAELYSGAFERADDGRISQALEPERVGPPEALARPVRWEGQRVAGAGSGLGVYAERLPASLGLTPVWPHLLPHAREVAALAAQDGLSAALSAEAALPVYLRDQVAIPA